MDIAISTTPCTLFWTVFSSAIVTLTALILSFLARALLDCDGKGSQTECWKIQNSNIAHYFIY